MNNPAQRNKESIMARIPEIVDRLNRWQSWYFTSQAAGVKSPKIGVRIDRTPRVDIPFDYTEEEALQTDRAVARLPSDLRKVVSVVYLDPEGRTMDDNARLLHMSRMTLFRKLELTDRFLLQELYDKNELVDCYRSES